MIWWRGKLCLFGWGLNHGCWLPTYPSFIFLRFKEENIMSGSSPRGSCYLYVRSWALCRVEHYVGCQGLPTTHETLRPKQLKLGRGPINKRWMLLRACLKGPRSPVWLWKLNKTMLLEAHRGFIHCPFFGSWAKIMMQRREIGGALSIGGPYIIYIFCPRILLKMISSLIHKASLAHISHVRTSTLGTLISLSRFF